MAKFLNKKEQVIDFQLTPYGKQRMSVGRLKPMYYSFFDDGIIYDSKYANFSEPQNDIQKRITDETQFLEGILSFTDIENFDPAGEYLHVASGTVGVIAPEDIDISPLNKPISTNKFSYGNSIGDVKFSSENIQFAPANKIVACQGQIIKIKTFDDTNYDFNIEPTVETLGLSSTSREFDIPQIDVDLFYTKIVDKPSSAMFADTIQETINQTPPFADGNVIKLIKNDLVVYAEEINTELLGENYEVEVFEILTGSQFVKLDRKYFKNFEEQIVDGFMKFKNHDNYGLVDRNYDNSAVEYYFDVLTDSQVDAKIACGCAESFSENSYYLDLDIDCENVGKMEELYFDIYGSVTVPEICQPTNSVLSQQQGTRQYTADLEPLQNDGECED